MGFMVFFKLLKEGSDNTSCFLTHQKLLIVAKVIKGRRSALLCAILLLARFSFAFIISKIKFLNFKIDLLLQFLSNRLETVWIDFSVNFEKLRLITEQNYDLGLKF